MIILGVDRIFPTIFDSRGPLSLTDDFDSGNDYAG